MHIGSKIISKLNHIKLQFSSIHKKLFNMFRSAVFTARVFLRGSGSVTLLFSVNNNLFRFIGC